MENIISASRVSQLNKDLKQQKKKIVLVGGCFDILHPGHIVFLEKAKKAGDTLVVFLESDQKVKQLKGRNRPVHTQKIRARVLSALRYVDFVVLLPFLEKSEQYDVLVSKLKPAIIAQTQGSNDPHKSRAARIVGAKLKYVTRIIGNYSTSKILLIRNF